MQNNTDVKNRQNRQKVSCKKGVYRQYVQHIIPSASLLKIKSLALSKKILVLSQNCNPLFPCLLLQEFLFQLPSTLSFLLYYLAIVGVLYGIYQWEKASAAPGSRSGSPGLCPSILRLYRISHLSRRQTDKGPVFL